MTAAFDPPRALGRPLPAARLKTLPEDFLVEERLSFTPSGEGPHRLLRVEKRAANTRWVAAELARLGALPPRDVGYAGLKDRHAVAVQWFSVPAAARPAEFWAGLSTPEFRVLEVLGNNRKLQRGALAGNLFHIRLRGVDWPRDLLEDKLAALRARGAPNYFGAQRFGRGGGNLDRAAAWAAGAPPPRDRAQFGFGLSAARALIFNAVLARRVVEGTWCELVGGDLANLDGSGSHFRVDQVDAALRARVAAFDVHPTGPLWGRGEPATGGPVLALESEVAAQFAPLAGWLAGAGLVQERRALRCAVHELAAESEGDSLRLTFRLGRGQFATAVLAELCELHDVSGLPLETD